MKHILLVFITTLSLFAKTYVYDNVQGTKHINVSRSDVNRLVFPYKITSQVDSKEKDLTISVVGKELFVKFTPYTQQVQSNVKNQTVQQGKPKILYWKSGPAELFIVTEKKTYSIILHPKRQETTTVIFNESFDDKKKKIFEHKDAEYVDNLTNYILKPALINNEIDGFKKEKLESKFAKVYLKSINCNLEFRPSYIYKGYRFNVYEYEVKNPNSFLLTVPETKPLLLNAIQSINKKPLAYTLFYNNRVYKIFPQKSARLLIITNGDVK